MKTALLIALVIPGLAYAQAPDEPPPPPPDGTTAGPPPPPPPTPQPEPTPGTDVVPAGKVAGAVLPNFLDTRRGATVDVRGDYTQFSNGSGLSDSIDPVLAFTLHGQWISPSQGYGGYVTLPYYYVDGDVVPDQNKGIGNLELGGLYSMKQGGNSELLLRGAFVVDSGGMSGGILGLLSQVSPRLKDAYTTGLDTNWARVGGSFHHAEGALRIAAGAGFDFPLDSSARDNFDGLAHGEISVGIEQPGFGAAVGYVILIAVGTDSSDKTISGLNVSADVPISPAMKLYGAFGLPDLENNADKFDIWSVGVGLRAAVN